MINYSTLRKFKNFKELSSLSNSSLSKSLLSKSLSDSSFFDSLHFNQQIFVLLSAFSLFDSLLSQLSSSRKLLFSLFDSFDSPLFLSSSHSISHPDFPNLLSLFLNPSSSLDSLSHSILLYFHSHDLFFFSSPITLPSSPLPSISPSLSSSFESFPSLLSRYSSLNHRKSRLFSFINSHVSHHPLKSCHHSKYENIIFSILSSHPDILYFIDEKDFTDLHVISNLRFDFFCILKNNSGLFVPFIIEFDGIHHWKGFNSFDSFYFMKHDIIKDFFAWYNGFSILRISYKSNSETRISSVINDFISLLKSNNSIIYHVDDVSLYRKKINKFFLHFQNN